MVNCGVAFEINQFLPGFDNIQRTRNNDGEKFGERSRKTQNIEFFIFLSRIQFFLEKGIQIFQYLAIEKEPCGLFNEGNLSPFEEVTYPSSFIGVDLLRGRKKLSNCRIGLQFLSGIDYYYRFYHF